MIKYNLTTVAWLSPPRCCRASHDGGGRNGKLRPLEIPPAQASRVFRHAFRLPPARTARRLPEHHAGDDRKYRRSGSPRLPPDRLQGHRGPSSYPTAVPSARLRGDLLRSGARSPPSGVALYLHYPGVGFEAIIRHPDWPPSTPRARPVPMPPRSSVPTRRALIPQLRELAGVRGADGVIDGECWASVADYGDAALRAFRDTTGIQTVPRKPGEAHWFEFLHFQRELFRQYLRRYIAAVKQTNPNFELCSNWAYTDHMAEPVSAPLDFLSGDYSPGDSVNSARLSGRYLVRQGTPWDLMAWSFTRKTDKQDWRQKTAIQLQREAAVVVALRRLSGLFPPNATAPSTTSRCRSWPRWRSSAAHARRFVIAPNRCRRWRCCCPPRVLSQNRSAV